MRTRITLLFSFLLLFMGAGWNSVNAEDYGFYVGEKQVTSSNKSDIMGDGYFSYNPSTKTLTVKNGAVLNNQGGLGTGIYNRGVEGLVIDFAGNATFNTRNYCIDTENGVTAKIRVHNGYKVSLKSSSGVLVTTTKLSISTVDHGGELELSGPVGINGGSNGTGEFEILSNCWPTITIKATQYAMKNLAKVNWGECKVAVPMGGSYYTSDKVLKDAYRNIVTTQKVVIAPKEKITEYPILFGETYINNYAAEDLLNDGSKSIRYVASSATKGTLYLNNASFTNTGALGDAVSNRGVTDLTVNVKGTNTLTGRNCGLSTSLGGTANKLTIEGGGTLNLVSNESVAFYLAKNTEATVNSTTLNVKGYSNGIQGAEGSRLFFKKAKADITCGSSYQPIYGLTQVTCTDCDFAIPAGVYWKTDRLAYSSGEYIPNGTHVVIGDVTKYDISINGTPVTNYNKDDIMGDGKVSYDVDYNRIDLNNATIKNKGIYIGDKAKANVRIYAIGKSTVNGTNGTAALNINNNYVSLMGEGTVTFQNGQHHGILINKGGVEVTGHFSSDPGPTVYVKQTNSNYGAIEGQTGAEKMTISKAHVEVQADGWILKNLASFQTIWYPITEPSGAYFDETQKTLCYYNGSQVKSDRMVIEEVDDYGIDVAGIRIHSKNCNNVQGAGISGTVTYDRATNTLFLTDAIIDSENWGIMGRDYDDGKGFNIHVEGSNKVRGKNYNGISITNTWPNNATLISGNGTLMVSSENNDGFYYGTNLTIEDCFVSIVSNTAYGMNGNGSPLTVTNARLSVSGSKGAIAGVGSLTLNGTYISYPENGVYDSTAGGICPAGSSGLANDVLIDIKTVEEYNLFVGGVSVTSDNAASITSGDISGDVSFDPSTWTLYLKDGAAAGSINAPSGYKGPELNIVVEGVVRAYPINTMTKTTISGSGSNSRLNTNGLEDLYAVNVLGGNNLTIKDILMRADAIIGAGGVLTIENALVYSGKEGGISGFDDMALIGVDVVTPNSAVYDKTTKQLPDINGNKATDFRIEAVTYYGIWVGDVQINDLNNVNIADKNISGTVSYDNATHTLTFDNATLTMADSPIKINPTGYSYLKSAVYDGTDLTVELKGENKYTMGNATFMPVNLAFKGDGSMQLGNIELDNGSSLTVNGCSLTLPSIYGDNSNTVSISSASVKLSGNIDMIGKLLLGEKMGIVEPAGGKFDESKHCIVDKSGNKAAGVLIRVLTDEEMGVEGITADGSAVQSVYNAQGLRTDGVKKGVNIIRLSNGSTRKIMVK